MKKFVKSSKYFLIVIASLFILSGCSLMECFFPTKEIETYNFSGVVTADGLPLKDAKVSCGINETTTDENGAYSFSNLSSVVQVKAEKDGYYFEDEMVYVKSNKTDVNFAGYKLFEVSGIVENLGKAIPNATVTVVSKSGTYTIEASDRGEFYLSRLAGECKIIAQSENYSFFEQTCNIQTSDNTIIVNGATEINGKINCDIKATKNDFVLKINGTQTPINDDLSFNIKEVRANSKITLESSSYFIENEEIIIDKENKDISFNCQKYYDAVICVKSGNTNLEAQILLNGKKINALKEGSNYVLRNLRGNSNTISAIKSGFNFNEVNISNSEDVSNVTLIGTFNVTLNTTTDDNKFEGISYNLKNADGTTLFETINSGVIAISNVQLDYTFEINANLYTLSNLEKVSNNTSGATEILNIINATLKRSYKLNLDVKDKNTKTSLSPNVIIDGTTYAFADLATLPEMSGEKEVNLELTNYQFKNPYKVNHLKHSLEIFAVELFSLSGTINSGDIQIENATISTQNRILTIKDGMLDTQNSDAENVSYDKDTKTFTFNNLGSEGTLLVVSSGYNNFEINYGTIEQNLDINLTYNISGQVLCGTKGVKKVAIKVTTNAGEIFTNDDALDGAFETNLDGTFEIRNLYGRNNLEFSKNYYKFAQDKINTTSANNLENSADTNNTVPSDIIRTEKCVVVVEKFSDNIKLNSAYKIVGSVSRKVLNANNEEITEYLPNFIVDLIDVNAESEIQWKKTSDGTNGSLGSFEFDNLVGEYYLTVEEQGIVLVPDNYQISEGGIYNFDNSGYSFRGQVLCGGFPVAGVEVTVDGITVETESDGSYVFDLVTKPSTIVLRKEGYTFKSANGNIITSTNGMPVDKSFNGSEINFTATYQIVCSIKSGKTALTDVTFKIQNQVKTATYENGKYTISGLEGKGNLIIEKIGYNFNSNNISFAGAIKNLEIKAYFGATMRVSSGDLATSNGLLISGVKVTVGTKGEYTTNSDGEIYLSKLEIGDTYTLLKENFNFNDGTFLGFVDGIIEVKCSYKVAGTVYCANNTLGNVKIIVNGNNESVTYSNETTGYFVLENLVGKNILSFELENYAFEDKVITDASFKSIYAKYTITGQVLMNGKKIAGVSVYAEDLSAETNVDGIFRISGISSVVTLRLVKEGYGFTGNLEVNAPTNLEILANYTLSGVVKSGDVIVRGVLVVAKNNGREVARTSTDSQGLYTIKGLTGETQLTISKEGYGTTNSDIVDDYKNDLDLNITYKVIISFSGISEYSGISIGVNGKTSEYNGKVVTIENLSGKNLLTFAKTGLAFSPANYNIEDYRTISVLIKEEFTAYFWVKTDDGLIIKDATVRVGSDEKDTGEGRIATVNEEGMYTLNGITKGDLVYANLVVKGVYSNKKIIGQMSKTETKTISTFTNKEYGYFMFARAFQYLRDAKSYQIKVNGRVVPDTNMSGPQQTQMIFKKDANGNRLFENLNYGEKVEVLGMGVDPRISMLIYTDFKTKKAMYQLATGGAVSSNLTASYSSSWATNSKAESKYYNTNYFTFEDLNGLTGASADGFYPYNINFDTINSISKPTKQSNGETTFELTLTTNDQAVGNYKKLMNFLINKQTPSNFRPAKVVVTFYPNDYIKTMYIEDVYDVTAYGQKVTTYGYTTYNFKTNCANETITPISLSQDGVPNDINASLQEETPSERLALAPRQTILIKRREI